jgi:hypothetical protein
VKKYEFNSLSEALAFIKGLKAAQTENIKFKEENCSIKNMMGVVIVEIKNDNNQ